MKNLKETKKLVKGLTLALLFVITFTSCSKDDDVQVSTELTAVSYSPDKVDANHSKAFAGTVAKLSPTKASATFAIKSIKKGDADFTNPQDGFSVDTSGKVSLKDGNTLEKAVYKLTIEATDKKKNTVKKSTVYQVTIK